MLTWRILCQGLRASAKNCVCTRDNVLGLR